jgi:hypothetical protein
VLDRGDFTYLGYYNVQTNSNDSPYGQALTLRRVDGDLRFLTLDWDGPNTTRVLSEFSIGSTQIGGTVTGFTNRWRISPIGAYNGIWWDDARQVLWSSAGPDYTTDFIPGYVGFRTLNANGTVSNEKGFSLNGIPGKRTYGGVQRVPAWFQAQYGVGPYVTGWGGYTSLMAQGGGASLGLTCYAFPDPASLANGASLNVKTCADHISGTRNEDWYKNTGAKSPSSFDRGIRVTPVENYFDGGDPRPNPPTRPTEPSIGYWLSPAPDGFGRWTWGDSYYNNCNWIETSSKKGFVCVAALAGGKAYYQSSSTSYDKRTMEMHVFDPTNLGLVVQGALPPWAVQPSNLWELSLPGIGGLGQAGSTTPGNVAGAAYDAVSGRLYLMGFQGGGTYVNRLYVFQVAQ